MKPTQTTLLGIALLLGGLMLCGSGLWLLFSPPQYQATVRIKIEPDFYDSGMSSGVAYDPYFIQTTFEIIRSDLVLGNVSTNLSLNEIWGKKHGHGEPWKTSQTVKRLQRHLQVEPIHNIRLVDISFTSDDPNEAAKIANAIAAAYKDYRMNIWREQMTAGIKAYEQQYSLEGQQILILQTNVEQLRQKFEIQSGNSTNQLSEQQLYLDEKRQLNQLIDQHRLLYLKMEAVKIDGGIPKNVMVVVIDPAKPPTSPLTRNFALGISLLIIGLFPAVAGLLLLKSSRQPIT